MGTVLLRSSFLQIKEIYIGARLTGSWPEQTPGLGMGPNTSAGHHIIEVRTIGGDANLSPKAPIN